MRRREVIKRLIGTLAAANLQQASSGAAEPRAFGAYEVQSPHLRLRLAAQAEINEVTLHPEPTKTFARRVSGQTVLAGCKVRHSESRRLADGALEFRRILTHEGNGQSCQLRERFVPTDSGSIRWEIEVLGDGSPWSTPIETHFAWPVTAATKFWTTWGNNRSEASSGWHDPLIPAAFGELTLFYGGKTVEGGQAFSVPIATVLEPGDDTALSLALSPVDTVPEMSLRTTADGKIVFSRLHHRISKEAPARFALDLVTHPADWRSGLGWLVTRYPQYFDPPNPLTHQVGGLGAYSEYEGQLDAYKLLSMGFRVNWKASYDYYYMGMFLPPLDDDVEWVCNRSTTGTPEFPTSIGHLRRYSESMRKSGFYVLNYFNACEFGEHVHQISSPLNSKSEQNLWRDPSEFVFKMLRGAIMHGSDGKMLHGWERDVLMDPGEPAYQQYLLEQARRHIEKLPASSGLCIDELQYLRQYNRQRDDGITWKDGKPVRALVFSWQDFMSKLSPLMHGSNKVIYCNPLYRRLDLMQQLDGLFDESGSVSDNLNLCAFMALHKPHIVWTLDVNAPDPDTYLQRHLYLGAYPSAPVPVNNHDIMPCGATIDQYYVDYGPMFDTLRGRRWVLSAHAIEVEGQQAKANLFAIPGGYLAVLVMGGARTRARISLRSLQLLPGQKGFAVEVLQPGRSDWRPLSAVKEDDRMILEVPLQRGCAVVRLSYAWIRPEKHYFIENLAVTLGTTIESAQFRYTLDGQTPDGNSPIYTEPLTVKETATLKAALFRGGVRTGLVLTAELVKTPPPSPWIEPFEGLFNNRMTAKVYQPYLIAGAEIRYTLEGCELPNLAYSSFALPTLQACDTADRREVTSQSPLYEGPVDLRVTSTLCARTFVPGLEPSPLAVGRFHKLPPAPPLPKVYVTDLKPLKWQLADGHAIKNNRSAVGTPLSMKGKKYDRGLGVVSPSDVIYALEPGYVSFVAEVGLDDEVKANDVARAAFQVYVRNEREEMLVYSTPLLFPGEIWPIEVRLPLTLGRREIRLASNGSTNWDRVDWVNAGFL